MRAWIDTMLHLNPDMHVEILSRCGEVLQTDREQDVHSFFEEYPYVFEFACPSGLVISKMPLGSSFVTDFVLAIKDLNSNDPTPVVALIEIERPSLSLFTKSGDPTSNLTHAIRQVQNWKRWLAANRGYFVDELRRALESEPTWHEGQCWTRDKLIHELGDGFHDRYIVIAGRREQLKRSDRLLLGQMNRDLRDIVIITYDVVIDAVVRNARLRGYGTSWRESSDEY